MPCNMLKWDASDVLVFAGYISDLAVLDALQNATNG